ncbi:MAG: YceH family protein [Solirubrobacterales bacterium]
MYDLTPIEQRILGCLLEKQRTTPDAYPLTLNALRLACNQSTNRDPVVEYSETEIQDALQLLHRRELTRVASGHGSRSSKYRHLVTETLGLDVNERAVLSVLLLRGDQTSGELKQRTERLGDFEDLAAIEAVLDQLTDRRFVRSLERRPGEKQPRYRQMLGDAGAESPVEIADGSAQTDADRPRLDSTAIDRITAPAGNGLSTEIAQLRAAVKSLSAEVSRLRAKIDGDGD